MRRNGLDEDGFIEREGSLERVQQAFAPVVAAARTAIPAAFAGDRLHSAYLYGSVPRGTAVPGRSDLDVLLALAGEPADADRAAARRLEGELDAGFPQIDGAGILLYSAATLLSDLERHDLGWFVACLCTPLAGKDLGRGFRATGPHRCWPGRPTATSATCSPAGTAGSARHSQPPAFERSAVAPAGGS